MERQVAAPLMAQRAAVKVFQAAIVRHRTKVTRGPGSRAAGLAVAFKLIGSARPP
jgi:hypothetical protein